MKILENLTKSHNIPLLGKVLGRDDKAYSKEDLRKFKASQDLALNAASEVGKMLRPGWTEKKTAKYLDIYLKDYGVKGYLHQPFAWFGERTRFRGCGGYADFMPSDRELKDNEAVILDIAPILEGYPADIGYPLSFGEVKGFDKAREDLIFYKTYIKELFTVKETSGGEIWNKVNESLIDKGYDNIHQKYPMHVLGHKMYPMPLEWVPGLLKPFSWQAYWSLASRGLFSETLTSYHKGELKGLWAIEPHLGGENFGIKFEEMLWVGEDEIYWLSETEQIH